VCGRNGLHFHCLISSILSPFPTIIYLDNLVIYKQSERGGVFRYALVSVILRIPRISLGRSRYIIFLEKSTKGSLAWEVLCGLRYPIRLSIHRLESIEHLLLDVDPIRVTW